MLNFQYIQTTINTISSTSTMSNILKIVKIKQLQPDFHKKKYILIVISYNIVLF